MDTIIIGAIIVFVAALAYYFLVYGAADAVAIRAVSAASAACATASTSGMAADMTNAINSINAASAAISAAIVANGGVPSSNLQTNAISVLNALTCMTNVVNSINSAAIAAYQSAITACSAAVAGSGTVAAATSAIQNAVSLCNIAIAAYPYDVPTTLLSGYITQLNTLKCNVSPDAVAIQAVSLAQSACQAASTSGAASDMQAAVSAINAASSAVETAIAANNNVASSNLQTNAISVLNNLACMQQVLTTINSAALTAYQNAVAACTAAQSGTGSGDVATAAIQNAVGLLNTAIAAYPYGISTSTLSGYVSQLNGLNCAKSADSVAVAAVNVAVSAANTFVTSAETALSAVVSLSTGNNLSGVSADQSFAVVGSLTPSFVSISGNIVAAQNAITTATFADGGTPSTGLTTNAINPLNTLLSSSGMFVRIMSILVAVAYGSFNGICMNTTQGLEPVTVATSAANTATQLMNAIIAVYPSSASGASNLATFANSMKNSAACVFSADAAAGYAITQTTALVSNAVPTSYSFVNSSGTVVAVGSSPIAATSGSFQVSQAVITSMQNVVTAVAAAVAADGGQPSSKLSSYISSYMSTAQIMFVVQTLTAQATTAYNAALASYNDPSITYSGVTAPYNITSPTAFVEAAVQNAIVACSLVVSVLPYGVTSPVTAYLTELNSITYGHNTQNEYQYVAASKTCPTGQKLYVNNFMYWNPGGVGVPAYIQGLNIPNLTGSTTDDYCPGSNVTANATALINGGGSMVLPNDPAFIPWTMPNACQGIYKQMDYDWVCM